MDLGSFRRAHDLADTGSCGGSAQSADLCCNTPSPPIPALNAGQIYSTLARLERDGLIVGRGVVGDSRGKRVWELTESRAGGASGLDRDAGSNRMAAF
jgi:Transcriptional regulator PadR-like family